MSSDSIWTRIWSESRPDPEIAEITKISSFREKSRFWRFWRFLALDVILARFAVRSHFPGQTLDPTLDPGSGLRGWSEGLSGRSNQVLDPTLDPGPGWTSQMDLRPAEKWLPGAIYRPLSITTLVENDWGRWGPFWRSPLTLALETVQF